MPNAVIATSVTYIMMGHQRAFGEFKHVKQEYCVKYVFFLKIHSSVTVFCSDVLHYWKRNHEFKYGLMEGESCLNQGVNEALIIRSENKIAIFK